MLLCHILLLLNFLLLFVTRQSEENGENGFQIALVYICSCDVFQWNSKGCQKSQASGDVICLQGRETKKIKPSLTTNRHRNMLFRLPVPVGNSQRTLLSFRAIFLISTRKDKKDYFEFEHLKVNEKKTFLCRKTLKKKKESRKMTLLRKGKMERDTLTLDRRTCGLETVKINELICLRVEIVLGHYSLSLQHLLLSKIFFLFTFIRTKFA